MMIGAKYLFGAFFVVTLIKAPKKVSKTYQVSFGFLKKLDWNYFLRVLLPANR
jgi:hypothetical protein